MKPSESEHQYQWLFSKEKDENMFSSVSLKSCSNFKEYLQHLSRHNAFFKEPAEGNSTLFALNVR